MNYIFILHTFGEGMHFQKSEPNEEKLNASLQF